MTLPKPNFRPDFNITRASHAVLHVRDLAKSRAFYVDTLGFVVSGEDAGTLHLRGLEEACFHSLVLRQSPNVACGRIGFRTLTNDDLEGAFNYFKKAGLPAAWVEVPYQSRTFHATDPVGTLLEFCANMETQPRHILSISRFTGACPLRLDHFQVVTPEVPRAYRFYMDLGFRLSEYITADNSDEPSFAFLQRKGNPHDVVFAHGAGPRLHHAAFTVPESYHLLSLCDRLAEAGFGANVEYGPKRHYGPGYARFVYLRDPDGHRIEFFSTHYQTIDSEDEPIRYTFSQLFGAGWGAPPPESWLTGAMPFEGVAVKEPSGGVGMKQALDKKSS